MVEYLANLSWVDAANTTLHPLLALTDTPPYPEYDDHTRIISADLDASITVRLLPISPVALLRYANVYVNDFIALAQKGPEDLHRVLDHVFRVI